MARFVLLAATLMLASGCMRAAVREPVASPYENKSELQQLEERLGV